jgi:predicted ArsR family transcriptional regulator
MLELLGKTQQEVLRLLNGNHEGLTILELSEFLNISRTAVKQHLISLQNTNLIDVGDLEKSGGRPTQRFILTSAGKELFPRQYSLFAQLLIETLQADKKDGLQLLIEKMGESISKRYLPLLSELRPKERIRKVADILSELGYQAEIVTAKEKKELSQIKISNCVYHQLAMNCPEVCSFDKTLLEELTGREVEMQSCIIGGAAKCCFAVRK